MSDDIESLRDEIAELKDVVEMMLDHLELRLHRDWDGNAWLSPKSQPESSP